MAFSRYTKTSRLALGSQYGTSYAIQTIRKAITSNLISYKTDVIRGNERLDTIAGSCYGDSRYWWVIAAASGIGWNLQIPPGTIINIPDLNAVSKLMIG